MNKFKKNVETKSPTEETKPTQYALGKYNYLFILISVILIIVGFVLMTGEGSTDEFYNPDIFSTQRIVIAPTITFIGFVCIIFAILRRPKDN
jgi:low temperature requirement protein LtrA